MTDEEIIKFARTAKLGTSLSHHNGDTRVWIEGADWHDELKAFAELVAAKERKACAKVVDAEMDEWDDYDVNVALNNVAVEIRARGE